MNRLTLVTFLALLSSLTQAKTDLITLWEQARQADTGLASARIQQDIANGRVDQGLARLLPKVNASASYSLSGSDVLPDSDQDTTSVSVNLTQPVYYQNAFYYYSAFKEKARGSVYSTSSAEQALMLDVAETYLGVLKAKDQVNLSQAELLAVERQLQQTEKRYEVGLDAITDVLDARATYATTRVSLITAEGNYQNALQSLSVLAGQLPDAIAELPAELTVLQMEDQGVEYWLDIAVNMHPGLLAARQNVEFQRLSWAAKKSERLPTLDATYSYGQVESSLSGAKTGSSSSLALRLSLPLYTGGQLSAEIAEAGLNLNSAEQSYEENRRNTELNIRLNHRLYQTSQQNLSAQQQAVEARQSALNATQAGYELGTKNIVEVLNAQRALFAARLNFRMVQYDLLLNQLKIKQAAGVLKESDLETLNHLLVLN